MNHTKTSLALQQPNQMNFQRCLSPTSLKSRQKQTMLQFLKKLTNGLSRPKQMSKALINSRVPTKVLPRLCPPSPRQMAPTGASAGKNSLLKSIGNNSPAPSCLPGLAALLCLLAPVFL
jgi:hypothetical protein